MTYKIESILKLGSIKGNYGELHKYAVKFEGQENTAEMMLKPTSPVPAVGTSLEGELTNDPRWGLKFKRTQTGGHGGASKNEPQRQSSIEWQSARRDAVDYCIAKSRLLFDLGKKKEAEEELSGLHIFQVALYFKGIETGATQLKNKEPGVEAKQEELIEDKGTVYDGEEEVEINLNDIDL